MKCMIKKIIKTSLAKRGLEIKRISNRLHINNKEMYSVVLPGATFSPWLSDTEFNEIYTKIKSSTFIDIYRCYELWLLVEQSLKKQGNLIEIGVWRGGEDWLGLSLGDRIFEPFPEGYLILKLFKDYF